MATAKYSRPANHSYQVKFVGHPLYKVGKRSQETLGNLKEVRDRTDAHEVDE